MTVMFYYRDTIKYVTNQEISSVPLRPACHDCTMFSKNGANIGTTNKDKDSCLKLWLHALTDNSESWKWHVLSWNISWNVGYSGECSLKTGVETIEHIVHEVESDIKFSAENKGDVQSAQSSYQKKVITCIYLVKILVLLKISNTEQEMDIIHRAVYKFVRENPIISNGYTPLHMCCNHYTYMDYVHTLQYILSSLFAESAFV